MYIYIGLYILIYIYIYIFIINTYDIVYAGMYIKHLFIYVYMCTHFIS